MTTVLAAVCVWATGNVLGFWVVRTVLAERLLAAEPRSAAARSSVVRQLDLTILLSGIVLAGALVSYIAIGVRG